MSEDSDRQFRFERKYHVRALTGAEVEDWVHRCPALFREVYAPRWVNNIYLDTDNLAAYRQNLDGLADRTKLRIRWYGALFGPIGKPVLEFKIKRGMVGTKDSYRLVPFTLEKGFHAHNLESVFRASELPESVRFELAQVTPALINRYHRKYFLSADGHYRVTIDTRLEFCRVHRHENQFLTRMTLSDSTVMELKYSGEIAYLDERITNFFPFRVTRMSKYVTGVEGVEG